MKYRIAEKETFKLVGFKKRVPIIFEGVNPEIVIMNWLLTQEPGLFLNPLGLSLKHFRTYGEESIQSGSQVRIMNQ